MKKIILGGLGLAIAGNIGYNYWMYKKVYPTHIDAMTYYYRIIPGYIDAIEKEYKVLDQTKESFNELYNRGDISMMTLYYESPGMILDKQKCKSTVGFSAKGKLSLKEEQQVSRGMKKVILPPFDAIAIPAKNLKSPKAMSMYSFILLLYYTRKVLKKQGLGDASYVPVIGITSEDKSYLCMPLPDFLKPFFFVENPIVSKIPLPQNSSQKKER